ncbi:MAG: hypothetical protein V2I54_14895 [Bacteroidales bacterium]|jgi:hypothetical protein|nr:hypothetical protein [Bacteroidales bacterium]
MKIFTTFLFSLSFIISGLTLNAQEADKVSKEQQIKSQKIAFFTDKIGLTPEEAEKFWPIYNSYWKRKNTIIAERKDKMTYFAENSENMAEKEMIQYADSYINYEMQLAELLDEYHEKFKEILPIKKVMKIYLADYEFKAYLLNKIRGSDKDKEE